MRVDDLKAPAVEADMSEETRALSHTERKAVAGGAGAFLRGSVVSEPTPSPKLTSKGQTAHFPVGIGNARFTQSGTTLCEWHKCTVYISGC